MCLKEIPFHREIAGGEGGPTMATMEGYMTKRGRVRKVGFVWLQLRASFFFLGLWLMTLTALPLRLYRIGCNDGLS